MQVAPAPAAGAGTVNLQLPGAEDSGDTQDDGAAAPKLAVFGMQLSATQAKAVVVAGLLSFVLVVSALVVSANADQAPGAPARLAAPAGPAGRNAPNCGCVFPFVYKHYSYSSCTKDDFADQAWCGLMADSSKWIMCDSCKDAFAHNPAIHRSPPPATAPAPSSSWITAKCKTPGCYFPFSFKGKKYASCTTDGNGGRFWCGRNKDSSGSFGVGWINCDSRLPGCAAKTCQSPAKRLCADCPCTTAPAPAPTPAAPPPHPAPAKVKSCKELGCQFPFTYLGYRYSKCVTVGHDQPWCGTVTHGAAGVLPGSWKNCKTCTPAPTAPKTGEMVFNGTNGDHYDTGVHDLIKTAQKNVFAFDAWVYDENPKAKWHRIFDFGNGPSAENIILQTIGTSGRLSYFVYKGKGKKGCNICKGEEIYTKAKLTKSTWTRITVIHDASTVATIYMDGVAQTVSAYSAKDVKVAAKVCANKKCGSMHLPSAVTRRNNYIGKSNWAADALFKGKMKNFRVWNKAVTLAQIMSKAASVAPVISLAVVNPGRGRRLQTGNATEVQTE